MGSLATGFTNWPGINNISSLRRRGGETSQPITLFASRLLRLVLSCLLAGVCPPCLGGLGSCFLSGFGGGGAEEGGVGEAGMGESAVSGDGFLLTPCPPAERFPLRLARALTDCLQS